MPAKKQPKVSILVPCYNVEKFLPECLDSIINQTLKDIEIICINDGSKDSTLDIIKRYAKKDKRFVVIDKENEGYGKSMNRGLDAATGEYVGIVESDDWVDSDMFESLVKIAEKKKVDVVKSNFYEYTTTNGKQNKKYNSLPDKNVNIVINPHEETAVFFAYPAIWSAIYKREFLVKNKIRFLESPGASFQDTGFNFKVFACTKRAYLTSKAWLHYRCDNENSSVKSTGKVFCVCDEYEEIERFFKERGDLDEFMRKLISRVKFGTYMWNLNRLASDAQKQFLKRFSLEYKKYHKEKILDRKYFDDKQWLKMLSIINPYNPIYPVFRAIISVIQPIYKTRISDGYKVYYIFNKIVIKKIKL